MTGGGGSYSDVPDPEIIQTEPVEAIIESVESLLMLYSVEVKNAIKINWYVNDYLVKEIISDGSNLISTFFDNDPLDLLFDLIEMIAGMLVPVRHIIAEVINSQNEIETREWQKGYYLEEPDPLVALVDSVSPSKDAYNLQVDGLTFTVNFNIPSSVQWIVDREYTGNPYDGVKSEVDVLSSSFSYDGDETIFGENCVVDDHHTVTAMITSEQYGYGCCGVHWKHWIIPSTPLIDFSVINNVTGSNESEVDIISTIALYGVRWDNAGYYAWDFRLLTYALSKRNGDERADFIFQETALKEIWNHSNLELHFEKSPSNHGASNTDSPILEVGSMIGSIALTLASLAYSKLGIALTGAEILSDIGEVTSYYVDEPEEKTVKWEHSNFHSTLHHWLKFEVRTNPGEGIYPENKISVKSAIWGPEYIFNRPTVEFEIMLPKLDSPNVMEAIDEDLPGTYGFLKEGDGDEKKWVLDDQTIIMGLMSVEALEGTLIQE